MKTKWIQKAIPKSHKGRLHRALGVAEDKTIPRSMIAKAAKGKGHVARMAQTAIKLKAMHHGKKK